MKTYRVPPLIRDIILTALTSLDTMEFSRAGVCRVCGGDLTGYDKKRKRFAVFREENGEHRTITVRVKRFRCRKCGALCYADEPFYPDSRIGSPIIDLFHSLSSVMPPSRAARVIDTLGIVVNRTTWRRYAGMSSAALPVVDVFGMRLPLCIVELSDIAVRDEGRQPDPDAVIAACRYPSRS